VATTTSGNDLQSKPVNALDRRKVLLPALAPLLLHTSTEIVDAAAIAIGRVGDAPEAELLVPLITHGNPKIREAAIIGLGLLRNARGAQSLVKLLQNPGTDSDDRALAAIALGLSGSHVARIALEDRLGKSSPIKGASRAKTRQLEGCRALGLGLIGDPDCIDLLTARVTKNSSRDANFEPMLLTALARLDEPATARTALRAVGHRKNDVRRSGWILAGRSVQPHETKLVKSLLKALSRERDRFARNMACIALGRIGHPSAVKVLTRLWAKGGNRDERCFAAIGLGISQDIDAVKKLRTALLKEKDLNLRGATAIALGIAGDNESGETLLKLLKTVGDPDLRSHIVWALGMLEFKEAQEELRRLMAGARKSELVMACGLALGVIGDAKALEILIGVLKSSGSITVKGAMARAIGRLGDGRASKALLALANDADQTDRTRSFAVVALGLLGDKRPRNDLSRISIDSNYALISCDALHRVLDIF
jgi:HEAT repeat protein